jgi:hypothetical protein
MHSGVLNRDEILQAIRDLAAELGRPPGIKAFRARYSTPASAFNGMYWARWTDAVREAGLQPCDPPARIEDGAILAALATLTLRLGRFPTQAEMAMRKKEDPSFPAEAVIRRRLGSKSAQIEHLRAWAASQHEYTDLHEVLAGETATAQPQVQPAAADEQASATSDGCVYLMRSGGRYKIGMSRFLPQRWATLAGASPDPVDLVHYMRTDDPEGIEAYWHRRFADRREGGEWFRLGATDVAAFRRRKLFM